MKQKHWIISGLIIFVISIFMLTDDAFCRGFSGGGRSFSSSRSSGRSWGSSSRSTTKTYNRTVKSNRSKKVTVNKNKSTNKQTTTKSNISTSRGTVKQTKNVSKADRKLYKQAKKNGKAFNNKKAALNDFKSKNKSKYPSKYNTQPSTRPAHISSSVTVGGVSRPVVFVNGGYGYYNSLGAFILYDAFVHNTMYMEGQMLNSGYYVGPPVHMGFSWVWFIIIVFVCTCIIAVACVIFREW